MNPLTEAPGPSSPTTQPQHDMHNRWPRAQSVEDFRKNLQAVQRRIHEACQRSHRDPSTVRLLPVSKTLDEAQAIKNTDIAEELALPPVKIHCSILAEDAIKAAVADYKHKKGLV